MPKSSVKADYDKDISLESRVQLDIKASKMESDSFFGFRLSFLYFRYLTEYLP